MCFDKSFASNTKSSIYWGDNGEIQPRDLYKCSGENVYLFVNTDMNLKLHYIVFQKVVGFLNANTKQKLNYIK